ELHRKLLNGNNFTVSDRWKAGCTKLCQCLGRRESTEIKQNGYPAFFYSDQSDFRFLVFSLLCLFLKEEERMSRTRVLVAWMLTLMALLLAATAFAQTASIKGTVTDTTGAAVVGAKVTAKGPLGIDRSTQTNSAGDYEILALSPGTYNIAVEMKGFQ